MNVCVVSNTEKYSQTANVLNFVIYKFENTSNSFWYALAI